MSKITLKLKRSTPAATQVSTEPTHSDEELLLPDKSLYEDEEPSLLPCEWAGCSEAFWEVEGLMGHIHHHVDAHPKSCLWNGCRFKGKNQTNKSSLVAHMRSHTGEKLHWCRLPECDKVFSRADALNKHERTVHTDAASKTNVAPKWTEQNTPAGSSSSSRKRKASPTPQDEGAAMGAGDSDLSDIDEPMLKRRAATAGDEHPPASEDYAATAAAASSPPPQAQPLDDPEVAAAIASHPDDDADQIRCIVMLAKLQHIEEEQARLKVEREAVAASRDALWSAKEELLNQVCDVELEPNWQDSLGPKGEMPAMWSLVTRSTLRTHR